MGHKGLKWGRQSNPGDCEFRVFKVIHLAYTIKTNFLAVLSNNIHTLHVKLSVLSDGDVYFELPRFLKGEKLVSPILNFVFLGGQSNPVDRKFRVFCFWHMAALIEIASKILKKFYMIVQRYVYYTQHKFHVKKFFS